MSTETVEYKVEYKTIGSNEIRDLQYRLSLKLFDKISISDHRDMIIKKLIKQLHLSDRNSLKNITHSVIEDFINQNELFQDKISILHSILAFKIEVIDEETGLIKMFSKIHKDYLYDVSEEIYKENNMEIKSSLKLTNKYDLIVVENEAINKLNIRGDYKFALLVYKRDIIEENKLLAFLMKTISLTLYEAKNMIKITGIIDPSDLIFFTERYINSIDNILLSIDKKDKLWNWIKSYITQGKKIKEIFTVNTANIIIEGIKLDLLINKSDDEINLILPYNVKNKIGVLRDNKIIQNQRDRLKTLRDELKRDELKRDELKRDELKRDELKPKKENVLSLLIKTKFLSTEEAQYVFKTLEFDDLTDPIVLKYLIEEDMNKFDENILSEDKKRQLWNWIESFNLKTNLKTNLNEYFSNDITERIIRGVNRYLKKNTGSSVDTNIFGLFDDIDIENLRKHNLIKGSDLIKKFIKFMDTNNLKNLYEFINFNLESNSLVNIQIQNNLKSKYKDILDIIKRAINPRPTKPSKNIIEEPAKFMAQLDEAKAEIEEPGKYSSSKSSSKT
jgi:hypothetical protein